MAEKIFQFKRNYKKFDMEKNCYCKQKDETYTNRNTTKIYFCKTRQS